MIKGCSFDKIFVFDELAFRFTTSTECLPKMGGKQDDFLLFCDIIQLVDCEKEATPLDSMVCLSHFFPRHPFASSYRPIWYDLFGGNMYKLL